MRSPEARGYLLSGAGNDFLALVEPRRAPDAETIRAWCTRGLSLGADGLFVLRRTPAGARMDYFNADGLPATLCLNGTRCAARLAGHLGWAVERLTVDTAAGAIEARLGDDETVQLALEPPRRAPEARRLEVDGEIWEGFFLTVGVPQLVLVWPAPLSEAPVLDLGARLRRHPDFGEAGTNVVFVRFPAPHRMETRSYERGVEAETLACGTGVLAASAVGLDHRRLELPIRALTAGGCELVVDGRLDSRGEIERWSLAGDARLLATVELAPGAARLPSPPAWS